MTKVTPELAAEWTRMRESGMTIEQVALEVGVSFATIQRHTPKGIHSRDKTHTMHRANRTEPRRTYLNPQASIVDKYVQRGYR